MRASILFVTLATLQGCSSFEPPGALLAADVAGVVVFGRGLLDLGVSAVSGRDCSVVRLDRGETYCAPRDVPMREAYCTRTLAAVDCWDNAALLPAVRPNVADTPPSTAAQDRYRAARWPKSLTAN